MNTGDLNLTTKELEELCHLYMDCKLSVLEEKELEYIIARLNLSSPLIDEVRSLMDVQIFAAPVITTSNKRLWSWKWLSGTAACLAVLISASCLFTGYMASIHSDDSGVYIAAIRNGERLSRTEAVESTDNAMSRADSLMNLASLTEREYMLRANNIINETFNN